MPVYTYRREDGTTFEVRQRFLDDPLTVDPETGQKVVRVVQLPGIIFKGSGFYVNDSKNASKSSLNGASKAGEAVGDKAESKVEASANGKADAALEKKVS
ncbi:MAG: FmdB family zinc ribbon protein [Aggregatilineales bacterium]